MLDGRAPEIIIHHEHRGCLWCPRCRSGRALPSRRNIDIGMAGNWPICGCWLRSPHPSGYVESVGGDPIIGAIAGVIVVARRLRHRQEASTTRSARSRPTGSRASGARWRAASSRHPKLASLPPSAGDGGLIYTGSFHQLGRPGPRRDRRVLGRVHPRPTSSSASSRRPTGCASPRRRSWPAWTSPSTGCTGTRSSSFGLPELVGYGAAPQGTAAAAGAGPIATPTEVPAT